MITEVLVYDETLRNPCIAPGESTNLLTFRPSSIAMYDINADGTPEIPSQTLFLPEDNRVGTDAVYLTKWLSYSGSQFVNKLSAVMNYSDGYYLTVPSNWVGKVIVLRNTEQRIRTFWAFDSKQEAMGQELLKLQVVAKSEYEANPSAYGNLLLAEREGYVYVGAVTPDAGKLGITESQLRDSFFLF